MNIQISSSIKFFGKVRGRKCVQNFLPHDVEDLEPVWMGVQWFARFQIAEKTAGNVIISENNCNGTIMDLPLVWESLYVMWIWLSTLSLVPFDVDKIVSSSDDNNHDSKSSFITKLILLCQSNISDSGLVREAAATCLSHWLSRPDPHQMMYVKSFVDFSLRTVQHVSELTGTESKRVTTNSYIFQVLGILQACTTILKVSSVDRERLVQLFDPLWDAFLALSDTLPHNNILIQRLLVKWWSRMGSSYLTPRIASWRYERGKRSLRDNSNIITIENQKSLTLVDKDELFLVPDRVEDALGRVIESLSNPSTVVRWSAAKGIGRITERLPSICGEDVVDAILLNFEDPDNDRCWHGACLALAELARRGLLLPTSLADVVPYITLAVHYDIRRGQSSVGSNVRDAGCYVYWAFARAYSPEILQPYLTELNEAVLLTTLFDREVNCRRAASAAFQEAVGRQGAENFDHGIDIITTADYFSVGNRSNSYLSIAPKIARFEQYNKSIIKHLFTSKLYHWDENIRILSSEALSRLTSLSLHYFSQTVVPCLLDHCLDEKSVFVRHGAVLGLAEVILTISKMNRTEAIESKVQDDLIDIVSKIEKRRLYRGRGGEIMRSAVCRFIECLCSLKFTLATKIQVQLLDSVEANIPHPNEKIQRQACEALLSLLESYFPVSSTGPSLRLQSRVVDKFIKIATTSDNAAVTRGYALSFGYLPVKLLAPNESVLISIVACLSNLAKYNSLVGNEGDAETRRNSLQSLIRIVDAVGFDTQTNVNYPRVAINSDLFTMLCEVFLLATDDYKSDRRGDVGSWCRILGMEGISAIFLAATRSSSCSSNFLCLKSISTGVPYPTVAIGIFLKQVLEKLDTVRIHGGSCLTRVLMSEQFIPGISKKAELIDCLGLDSDTADSNFLWTDTSKVFTRVLNAASIGEPIYFNNIVCGIVSSIGGLTEKSSNEASSALIRWAKSGDIERKSRLGDCLTDLLERYRGTNRLLIPIMKTLRKMFMHQVFDEVLKCHENQFALKCFLNLQREERVSRHKDVTRLITIIDVMNSLWMASSIQADEVCKRILVFMCHMLSHPFPRVRSYTAEQLFLLLQEHENSSMQLDSVLDVVLTTPWGSENHSHCKNVASRLTIALNLSEYDKESL